MISRVACSQPGSGSSVIPVAAPFSLALDARERVRDDRIMKARRVSLVSVLGLCLACGGEGGRDRDAEMGALEPVPDGAGDPPGASDPPSTPDGQSAPLPRSTPEAEGISSAAVLQLVDALDGSVGEIHSLVLVRHGKVVAEGFWAPYSPEDIHVLYSATKSFNGTAVGLAAEEGLLALDDLILSHFPDLAPAEPAAEMRNMRVRDLLTMSTGHDMDTMNLLRARADGQWTRAFLETSVPRPPGTFFLYNSGAAYVLSALVQTVTGTTVEEYLRPRLFEPLGIGPVLWGQSPEGVNMGDGGLSLRSEDLAKFGLLYLQGGMWNGERVLPEAWVAAATDSQISTGVPNNNWGHGYGYQFWRSQFGYRADGSLGQFCFVLPEQDMVLAITSGTNDMNGVMNAVWQHLVPAVQSAALPEDATALAALEGRLSTLSLPLPPGEASSESSAEVSGRRYSIAANNQGITALQLDFSGATPALTLEDAAGTHTIELGSGAWARGRTRFKPRINELFDTPEQGIAAAGAWEDADTFVAKLVFDETPYSLTAKLGFDGDRVLVDMTYNVRWGSTTEPQLTGSL